MEVCLERASCSRELISASTAARRAAGTVHWAGDSGGGDGVLARQREAMVAEGATLEETAPLSPSDPAITTGSDDLDMLLGGGIQPGKVTEIKGTPGAMLHVCCALAVTTQLPEAAPPNIDSQAPRFYGLKLFGGANGKVMIIDALGTFLDGRKTLGAVCRRFELDEEAVLDNITCLIRAAIFG